MSLDERECRAASEALRRESLLWPVMAFCLPCQPTPIYALGDHLDGSVVYEPFGVNLS
jgi:hypothetical protein